MKGLTKMSFNSDLTLYKNVQMGLWSAGKSITEAADTIGTTQAAVTTRINAKFIRNGRSTPLDKKIFEYLSQNCPGFSEYCDENDIRIVS